MISRLKRETKRWIAERLLTANRDALVEGGVFEHERLSEELWSCGVNGSGEMCIGSTSLPHVAERFGTPLHVIHVERMRRNMEGFLGAFEGARAQVRLGTSYKTNPVPFVLQKLHEWGTLAEVISDFELWLALELGMNGEQIIFNGPGKSRESLERAVEHGVGLLNVDSLEEIRELEDVCAARGTRQRIGIRVTTGVGWQSQFGIPVRDRRALDAYRIAAESDHLEPVGVHLHLGTGIRSVGTYVQGISEVLDLARQVSTDLGVAIRILDFGGGFGVPTTRQTTRWDGRLQSLGRPIRAAVPTDTPTVSDYASRIVPLVDQYVADTGVDAEVIFEPGRAITASAQMLLLSVLRVKDGSGGEPDLILDGGKNLCVPLGWEFHEIHPVGRMRDSALVGQNLYGPLCHPHDIIALHKPLPRLSESDIVAVMDAGAYFIPSQSNFSHPRPGIVAIENDEVHVVRSRESYPDVIRLDNRVTAAT